MKLITPVVCLAILAASACEEKTPVAAPKPASPAPKAPVPAAPTAVPPAAATPAPPAGGAPAAAVPADPAASGTVNVAGVTLAVPPGWKSVPPSNPMRLAEVSVPDASGDAAKACTVAFSTAGGDVESNIARWAGQVKDASGQAAKPTTTTRTVAGMPVHIAEMTGSYSAGMSDTTVHANWMLRGAIVETPAGMLFIKMTGPAEPMAAAGAAFNAMIDGLKRS